MPITAVLKAALATLGGIMICMAVASDAAAQDARLKSITLSSTDERMVVSLRVEGAFNPELLEAVRRGTRTEFTFRIRMYRDRRMWFDEKLIGLNLTHSLEYDPARRIFRVYRSWAPEPQVETRSLTEAQTLMSQIERVDMLPLALMQRGEGYELRAKAELSKVTLPYYLRYVFYFVSLWDFETEWHSVFFIY
jgi:hypothetical protein